MRTPTSVTNEKLMLLAALRATNGGVIDSQQAEDAGVSKQDISALVQSGQLVRIGRGQYVIPRDSSDPIEALAHGEDFIYSHQMALYLQDILDEPDLPSVTYPNGETPDPVLRGQSHIYFTEAKNFPIGLTLLETPYGNLVPGYDIERSICDLARAKETAGTKDFIGAITSYSTYPKRNIDKLNEYATMLGVSDILETYLRVLLPNERSVAKD